MTSFDRIARHYDTLMHRVPYDAWASYYKLLLAQMGVSPVSLLDVCCGTGTVAEMLAHEGYVLAGFDLSEPMVVEARRKAVASGRAIDYWVADARTLELGRRFDGAYSFFDSLNYIIEPAGLRAAVHRVAKHLNPGGSFVFDLNTAYAFEQRMFDQTETRRSAPIRYEWIGDYDPATRIIRVEMEFEHGGERFAETHVQRAHTDEEVRAFLAEAGFVEVRAYDSYTLDPPRRRSDRVHYTAVLPGG